MAMTPYYGGAQIPSPRNALVGMSGPQRLTTGATNALQGQMFPQHPPMMGPSSGGYGGMPWGQHPMMYQPMPGAIPSPQQGPQWPNPHAGAYQEWMQRFRPGPNQTLMR